MLSQVINVGIQAINIVVFFWLFWKFFGKSIMKTIDDKIVQEETLKKADKEYQTMIDKAHLEAQHIIANAHEHKDNLSQEGKMLGEQARNEIVKSAELKIAAMEEQAKNRLQDMEASLLSSFDTSVKDVSFSLVKKIVGKDKTVQESYLKEIINDCDLSSLVK
jgi:F0F1-type ATP synthase membrane subunit b/b'